MATKQVISFTEEDKEKIRQLAAEFPDLNTITRKFFGDESLDGVRRQLVPATGPAARRLSTRPDPRRDVHPHGKRRVLVPQRLAVVHLPHSNQVPRRGSASCWHSADARVCDEGLVFV